MKINTKISSVVVMILAIFAMNSNIAKAESALSLSGTDTGGVSASQPAAPTLSGTNTGGVSTAESVPTLSGTNTGGVSTAESVPTLSGTNTGGVITAESVPTLSGTNTGGVSTSVVPPSSGGSSSGGSSIVTPSTSLSGSSVSSGGGSGTVFTATTLASCSYINTYFKAGSYNDGAEVVKLKTFLNNNEGFKLTINGNYDEETINAVKSFQAKYAKDIMTPWGINTPTGHVFYTTQKKINELVCNKPISLTSAQLSAINAYKNGANTNTTVVVKADTKSGDVVGKDSKSNTDASSKNDSQLATPVKTSFASKVWKFTKWLFGY